MSSGVALAEHFCVSGALPCSKNTIRHNLHTVAIGDNAELRLGFEVYIKDGTVDYYIEENGETLTMFTGLEHAVDTYNDMIGDK